MQNANAEEGGMWFEGRAKKERGCQSVSTSSNADSGPVEAGYRINLLYGRSLAVRANWPSLVRCFARSIIQYVIIPF